MKFDPNANHAMWTREGDEVFKRFILRAKEDNCYVDQNGRVDVGAVVSLLVNSYADGRYTILPPKKNEDASAKAVEAVAEKIIEAKPKKNNKPKPKETSENTISDSVEKVSGIE